MKKKETVNKEFVTPKQEVREIKKVNLKELIGGGVLSREIVIRQIPFVLFLFAILLFYIANQYRGDKVMKEIVDVEKRLKDLRTESVSTAFQLMEVSKQTEVIRMLREKDSELEEAMEPPTTIKSK